MQYNVIISTTTDFNIYGEVIGYHTQTTNLGSIEGLIAILISITIFSIILLGKKPNVNK